MSHEPQRKKKTLNVDRKTSCENKILSINNKKKLHWRTVCFRHLHYFVFMFDLIQQYFSYVGTGLPRLNQY